MKRSSGEEWPCCLPPWHFPPSELWRRAQAQADSTNGYLVHNLVADSPSTATADFYDPRLINPTGNVSMAGAVFWFCDLGISTLYTVNVSSATPMGRPVPFATFRAPNVPGAGGSSGSCSGIVAPGGTVPKLTPPLFPVSAPGKTTTGADFLFVTDDGILSGFYVGVDRTQALTMVDNASTAVYKGLALAPVPGSEAWVVDVANFRSGAIDVFDGQYKPVTMPALSKRPVMKHFSCPVIALTALRLVA